MKALMTRILCVVLALCAASAFAACGGQTETDVTTSPATTEQTAAETSPSSAPSGMLTETDLAKLHGPADTGDPFSGYWHITDGVGSDLEHFVFGFDGNKGAYLLMGTMGFIGVYEKKTQGGKEIMRTQLLYGLNGEYTYVFSDGNRSAVLTNTATGSTTTIQKLESFSSIPEPPGEHAVDEELLGAWADETGEYLYFGSDGIMYTCQKNITYTFFTYSAAEGTISAQYSMNEPLEEIVDYSFKDGKLIYNKFTYSRISADELV